MRQMVMLYLEREAVGRLKLTCSAWTFLDLHHGKDEALMQISQSTMI